MAESKALPAMPVRASREISPSELGQRVAVIKRFRELLKAQRDRFQAYLNALDKQKDVIQSGSTDDLLHHVELEEKIVEDIFSIQRVIDPLEKMYQTVKPESPVRAGAKTDRQKTGDDEVASLKEALDGLKAEAVIRAERNRELLSKRMAELRSEIKSLRSGYTRRRFETSPGPSLIDLKG